MHFGIGKIRDVSRHVALVGQHCATCSSRQARLARHMFRGIATAWTGVDMSTSLFAEVVPELDANPEQKRLNLCTRVPLLLRRPPCWNKHGATRMTSVTRSSRRVRHMLWRDATSGIWAYAGSELKFKHWCLPIAVLLTGGCAVL